jgi:gamma-glutamyltranspeptidase
MANFDEIGWQAESKTGVVAAGGAAAVAAGISILDQGGNAADAAAGTILALNVTDHGACSIGGEVPVLLWDGNQVKSLSGMGRAPRSQTAIDWYMQHGIPDKDIKMAPVPSVVDLCITLLQRYGTLSFSTIIAPTLNLLDKGQEAWHPNLATTLRRMLDEELLRPPPRAQRYRRRAGSLLYRTRGFSAPRRSRRPPDADRRPGVGQL